jgi:hypothetical protein
MPCGSSGLFRGRQAPTIGEICTVALVWPGEDARKPSARTGRAGPVAHKMPGSDQAVLPVATASGAALDVAEARYSRGTWMPRLLSF